MNNRHQFRAKWHDYNCGIYFVTICSHNKSHVFGSIFQSRFKPYPLGEIVNDCILKIPEIHRNVEVWNYVVMPNHIHLILSVGAQYIAPPAPSGTIIHNAAPDKSALTNEGRQNVGCLNPPMHGTPVDDNHFNSALCIAIRTFKAAVTRIAGAQCIAPLPVWQRNYHEHIIRDQRAFDNIRYYIDTNVEKWDTDCFSK